MSEYEDRCIHMPNEITFNSYEEAIDDFKKNAMQNKNQIISRIKEYIERINNNLMFQEKSIFFRNIIISSLNRLLRGITYKLFIDLSKQDGCWSYSIYIFEETIQIRYQKIGYSCAFNQWMIEQYDTFYESETVLYPVREYAEHYNVADSTIREWIRRGKLDNAKKKGLEWFIPAITEPLDTSMNNIYFERVAFDDDLNDEPLIDKDAIYASHISIFKDEEEQGKYVIIYRDDNYTDFCTSKMSKKEMMRIRRRLIESYDFKSTISSLIYADNY